MGVLDVVVVRTGTANIASMVAGLGRAGAIPRVSEKARDIRLAERVVLPGVGAFGAVMDLLARDRISEALAERVQEGRPTLAVCLGMQLLCEGSDESPGSTGFRNIPGHVTRFPDSVRVPQLGWNRIEADPCCRFLESGYAYFANSYRLETPPPGWLVASAWYGGPFVAAMERGRVLACQFHPELSGLWGLSLLRRWLNADGKEGGCP
jgi:imidazole glycerol phosphate synthase glutamine amidotransferase subunit